MLITKAETENALEIFKRASVKSEPVVFSTDTIYGIGAPVKDLEANNKIFEIKGRDRKKPFPVLVSSVEQAQELACIDTRQKEIINRLWPGPFTLIFKAREGINSLFTLNGTIALRLPKTVWLTDVIKQTGPLSATSANLSGEDYSCDEIKILGSFSKIINFYVFCNNLNNNSSAIINLSEKNYHIVRNSPDMPELEGLQRLNLI